MDSHTFDEQPHTHAHTGGCGHLVQLYSDQSFLLSTLEDFICAGLDTGEAAIVIATPPHLHALEARLQARGIDLVEARNENRYIPFGAADAMDRFVVDGWPDASRFIEFLAPVMARARGRGRKVRGFGEMVAIMWARGQREAALELERLWSRVCARGDLTLLCAYPTHGFGRDDDMALAQVRAAHTGEVC